MVLLRERLGETVGWLLAPLARAVSRLRRARTFHPDGLVFEAEVEAAASSVLGQRLQGPALVRCSGALWRAGRQWPDALGVAVRFRRSRVPSARAEPGDQDLLFATILSPLVLPIAPFTTTVSDFFRNRYWAVAPFDAPGLGRVKFRLVPLGHGEAVGTREAVLRDLVRRGQAGFHLEVRGTLSFGWRRVASLRLMREVSVDQAALRFSPFRAGLGLVPRGFVHALRVAVYPASQEGRTEAAPVPHLGGGERREAGS
jgi:hypothetical protein